MTHEPDGTPTTCASPRDQITSERATLWSDDPQSHTFWPPASTPVHCPQPLPPCPPAPSLCGPAPLPPSPLTHFVGLLRHKVRVQHIAQHVGHVGQGHQPSAWAHQGAKVLYASRARGRARGSGCSGCRAQSTGFRVWGAQVLHAGRGAGFMAWGSGSTSFACMQSQVEWGLKSAPHLMPLPPSPVPLHLLPLPPSPLPPCLPLFSGTLPLGKA